MERICPFCTKEISWSATRCPHCTSHVPETAQSRFEINKTAGLVWGFVSMFTVSLITDSAGLGWIVGIIVFVYNISKK